MESSDIEVKPGSPIPYHADNVQGKLQVTQATQDTGSSAKKSILQSSSGHESLDHSAGLKRKVDGAEEDEQQQDGKKKRKKKNKNKNKKKKKTKKSEGAADTPNQTTYEKRRKFSNGLVFEEIYKSEPDGKRAIPGKKVSVKYIGKLSDDGKIFDSNFEKAPFQFKLGVGHVIKEWDMCVNGMRIGDKRRVTVPPIGYGVKQAGNMPRNSWLVFDFELVDVDG